MRLSERSVHAGVRNSFGRGVSFVAVVLFLTLLASVALAPIGERAAAASVRIASIVSVSGTVEVKKAGGKKYFKAYKDMPLNAGDHLKTGDKSSVTIRVQDRSDEATLGGGSSLYISELRDASGKKKSNFTLWTGSMWVKASTLVSTEDEFEVETPTAVMGVRGTNLFVTVDPLTGESMFMIASGVGQVFSKNNGKKDDMPSTIYPSQMLNTYFDEKKQSEKDEVVFVNLEQFVQGAGPGVIEAIIKNKAAIDKENEELLERLRQGLGPNSSLDPEKADGLNVNSIEDLERFRQNLEHFVANAVKEAIKQNKVDADTIRKLVEEANRSLAKKIDLDNAKEPVLTDKEKEQQRLAEQLKQQRDRLKQQQEQALAEQQKKQQELLAKLAEQARQKQEASQKILEEQKRKAEEEYLKKLEEEKLKAFLEAKKKLEEAAGVPTPTPSSTNAGTPSTPAPTPTPPAINQPGVIEGSLEQTVSGSANATYGPSEETVTVTGNLTIVGDDTATGVYTLRNMSVRGNLSVTVPNGSVVLLDSVSVEGTTTIVDVAANTFDSSASHEGVIEVQDSNNGARVILQGNAGSGTVRITGSGMIVLEGRYDGVVMIEGNAASIVLKGQFTGTVQVNVPNVTMTVDSTALFTGTLAINANEFSLNDISNKVGHIVPGSGIEVDQDILDKAKLSRLNQAANAEAVLAFLQEEEYAGAYLWHAEQLLAKRKNQQGGAGFATWELAWGAIAEVLELKEPGPALETEGELSADMPILAFTFDGENLDYQEWAERVYEVRIYHESSTEGDPLRTVAVNSEGEQDFGLATLNAGRLELVGSIFEAAGAGSYTLRLLAGERFDDVIHSFELLPTDWLSGDIDLTDRDQITQTIVGTEDREFGPSSESELLLEVPGNLNLAGDGSGTYRLRNLSIAGDLVIDLPAGSVVLEDSVTVTGNTYIDGISGNFATGGGFQPLVAVTEPGEDSPGAAGTGFASSAQHDGMIELRESDGAAIRLEEAASAGSLQISGGGEVLLSGVYQEDVIVTANATAASLHIAPDAKVMARVQINAPGVELDLQGILLDIGFGQQVGATDSVFVAQQLIEDRKQAILDAADSLNPDEGIELSGFKQALEAAGFELDRMTYMYLLFDRLKGQEGTLYSLLNIRDWLRDWSELPNNISSGFEEEAHLAIEDMPYGQPLRFVYSGFIPTPVQGNEGEGEWPEGPESFDWPDWFEQASGITISQTIGDEVIERYYPINSLLSCIAMPYGCEDMSYWDMTAFHPGEASVTVHGGFQYGEDWESGAVGLYEDVADLPFTIQQPVQAEWNDNGYVTQFVYGNENKMLGPTDPEQPATVESLTIRGSGSGTYTLQNIVITGELRVDIPNGSLVLGDGVSFYGGQQEITPLITILDVGYAADGGLIMNGLAGPVDIEVNDSNEARLELWPSTTAEVSYVTVNGPGVLKLAGTYRSVALYNDAQWNGNEEMPPSYRDIHLSEGAVIENMSLYSNAGRIRLFDNGGKILRLYAEGEPQGGYDSSITAYEAMLNAKLAELNEFLASSDYKEVKPGFESTLAFIGIPPAVILQSGEGMWGYLRTSNQSQPYSSLTQALNTLKYYQIDTNV
ncbi:FecR domain-containing protein [Paenibacillus sp. PAMC21692]|uniref:FecR domain-containing protein n=1 Tax=Paenibacillus sp. PAMC21692 TaxID=2762320 RepID=UPI00164DAADD|nr:FecR domain-containing protein [Paenibacillus sp. PAMC21692]QNK58790.1 FecR domain-containing protein [Paenibacillus sp. PAMC21692]